MTPYAREDVAAALEGSRRRTLALLAPLSDEQLTDQHSVLMSPLVWDLAHVANYEDIWLVRALGAEGVGPQHDHLYDAFRHPRRNRPSLPLLPPGPARAYAAEVRQRALELLDGQAFDTELSRGVYGMVVQHEHQHDETMLATLQLMASPYEGDVDGWGPGVVEGAGEVLVEGGPFVMGTDDAAWAYDNERPAHEVDVAPFWIDAAPVTVGAYRAFVDEGGYDRPEFWSDEGWKWRQEAGLAAPEFWRPDGTVRRFGAVIPLRPDEPVQHVCWHEAEAFARFAGKRLPTEAEWEKAARLGVLGGVGRVWEWTSSSFAPYPGFAAFPYREYSEVFFGDDYKVLRGASWATDASCRRLTFRNWDYPIRRQIFSGLRCARDAA